MEKVQEFYSLFCNHKFKSVTDIIQDGFSGMYFVLKILSDAERELSAGDISETFGASTARTAVVLTTLERKGFIEKSKSDQDARKTIVKLTEKGIMALQERRVILFNAIHKLLSKLDKDEVVSLYNILQKLLTA